MGGSHREAVEAVVLGQESKRRRGSPVVRSGEADVWAVEKGGGGESSSSGMVERRTVKEGTGGSRWLFKRLGGAGRQGKKGGGGGPGGRVHMSDGEGGEGAPSTVVGSAGRPVMAPDHRARAAVLSRNKGERLIGGAGRQRGPVLSGGVRERVRESGVAQRRGADR
jgi:hypothetical protein